MEFVKDFLIYEAGALCGFFIAALMNTRVTAHSGLPPI